MDPRNATTEIYKQSRLKEWVAAHLLDTQGGVKGGIITLKIIATVIARGWYIALIADFFWDAVSLKSSS